MTPIRYLWHLHGERWERAFDKINYVAKTIKAAHERFLGANNNLVRKGRVVPRHKKDLGNNQ